MLTDTCVLLCPDRTAQLSSAPLNPAASCHLGLATLPDRGSFSAPADPQPHIAGTQSGKTETLGPQTRRVSATGPCARCRPRHRSSGEHLALPGTVCRRGLRVWSSFFHFITLLKYQTCPESQRLNSNLGILFYFLLQGERLISCGIFMVLL